MILKLKFLMVGVIDEMSNENIPKFSQQYSNIYKNDLHIMYENCNILHYLL